MSKAFDSVKIKNAFAKFKEKADQTYNEKLVDGQTIKTINNQSILGSGNLDVKGVTEIATEYIRITDLDTGIYKLTWGGSNNVAVKLYYNGTTSTSAVTLNNNYKNTQPILYVTKLVNGTTYKWDWYLLGEYSNYDLTVYFGSTTTSNGSYSTKRLDQLLDNNNIISTLTYGDLSSTTIPNYTVLKTFLATGYNDTRVRTDGENISGTTLRGYMGHKLPVTINDIKYTYQRTDTDNSSIIYSAIANYYPDEITHTIYTARLDYVSNNLYLAEEKIRNVYQLVLNIDNGIPNTNFSYNVMPPQIMIFDVSTDVIRLAQDINNLVNLTIMFTIGFQTSILGSLSGITFLGAWQGYTIEGNNNIPFADFGELEASGLKYQVFILGTNLYLVNKNIYITMIGRKLPNTETIPVSGWCFIDPSAQNKDFTTIETLISALHLTLIYNDDTYNYTLDLTPNQKVIKKLPIVSLDEDVDRVVSYNYTIGDTELVADSGIYDFTTTVKIEQPMPQRLSIAQNLVVNINGEQFDMIGVNGGWYPLSKWSDPTTSGNYTYRTLQHREYDETSQQFTQYTTANLGKAKELLSFITGSEYFEIYNPNKPMPCFVFATQTKTCWKLQWENTSLRAYRVDNLPFAIKPNNETFTVASSDWVSDANIAPFDYKTTITVTTTIGANTIVELVNNNAVAFATYGFSIGDVTGQVVTIYSIGQPSANIDFLIKVGE